MPQKKEQIPVLLLAGVGALLLMSSAKGSGTASSKYPNQNGRTRGMKNNNPGNIILTNTVWDGETQGPDQDFKTFKSMIYGVKAIYTNLQAYYNRYNINTIRAILTRWAVPYNQNYVSFVEKCMGKNSGEYLNWSEQNMILLAKCITDFENYKGAADEIGDRVFRDAWKLFTGQPIIFG